MSRSLCALAVIAGCTTEPDSTSLDWVAPVDVDAVPAGDAVELAVETALPGARAVQFFVDGELAGTCDPAQPDEDCRLGSIWRWTVVFAAPGSHEVVASLETTGGPIAISRTVAVVPPPPDLDDAELSIDLRDDAAAPDGGALPDPELAAAAVNRGLLDPNRGFHSIFGGLSWSVKRQRVVLRSGTPRGSVSAINTCMRRFGPSIRHWADHFKVSRGSVVATAITESNCTNPAGSSDGLSSGPMQVTASTCAAITGLSRTTCRVRMHSRPDFSFQVGAKYMGSSFQRGQHHRDPPKIAAAYNAGSLRRSSANRWHLVSTGNHIDRFVRAYNAHRSWEAQHGVPRVTTEVESQFEGEHVATVDELPANAAPGQVVFVGDFAGRDGGFYEWIDGRWQSADAID